MTYFDHSIGSLISLRNREWVILPSTDPDLLLLRPLSGSERELAGVYLPLGLETPRPAVFPLPDPAHAGDYESARMLWDAARLTLRSGAGPFRALGRLSVRPRPYQLVPLLMALRLNPVRLLIADDVGVGKTIEAGLIARELLERGVAQRLAVLCPPYLCDQWQHELAEKFHIEAVVVRSGTAAQLERALPRQDLSIFEYYPHLIISVDYAKMERRRHAFLLHCPDLVIVDEAHACARPTGRSVNQQQRHELLRDLAQTDRQMLLLTATPHSGVEEAFRSLLGLLDTRFEGWNLAELAEPQRRDLARAFIQRRRADVARWLGEETPFPERISTEITYELTPGYRTLFNDVYAFAQDIIRSGETMSGFRQRIRYWTALALLRCVMSSPEAAQVSLEARAIRLEATALEDTCSAPDDELFSPYIYDDPAGEATIDIVPTQLVDVGEQALGEAERRQLRAFAQRAAQLQGDQDAKLLKTVETIGEMLAIGQHPILYCRYIATAEYVARELAQRFRARWPELHVLAVTGALAEEERQVRVAELSRSSQRVLVATDCLSEGINLQEAFDAVLHYDLPWNPNRLEQREGRVDRFGQRAAQVSAVLIYGADNPVDGAVLDVLIRKAVEIRRTLGISVPVPVESESVVEAVLRSLFLRGDTSLVRQMTLFEAGMPGPEGLHHRWDEAVAREQESRTRFAQHAIRPDEVALELQETDAVLGDPTTVERFVRAACQRLGAPLQRHGYVWRLDTALLPIALQERLNGLESQLLTFTSPTPEGAMYVGRNHSLTAILAELVFEMALEGIKSAVVARCAAIRTQAITRRTTVLLLRIRYLLEERDAYPALAEECVACAFEGRPGAMAWLPEAEALRLLVEAAPAGNVMHEERGRWLNETLTWIEEFTHDLERLAAERAERLYESHQRVRRQTKEGRLTVQAQLPADLLGVYVLMPVPQGIG